MESNRIPLRTRSVKFPPDLLDRAEKYVKDGKSAGVSELIRQSLEQKLVEVGY